MDFKKLTEADISAAKTYMPLGMKKGIVEAIAPSCTAGFDVKTDNGEAVIRCYKDDTAIKSLWLMTVLCDYYLIGADKIEKIMEADRYDEIAGHHIFNQLERFKSNAKTRDKIFDLLADYRDFEKRLNTEIYNYLQALNGETVKIMEQLALNMNPEHLSTMLGQMDEMQKQLEDFKGKRVEANG